MKKKSRTFLILGIDFVILSAVWFLWNGDRTTGSIWLTVGILELLAALSFYLKEKKEKEE